MLDTERFLKAQETLYPTALTEMKAGRKRSHWIWFIFPQLTALGRSDTARYYGIDCLEDARAYLSHPTLSKRLCEITEALLAHQKKDPVLLMSTYVDALKLRSSMTLFHMADPENPLFQRVLDEYFDKKPDPYTLALL